MPSAAEAAASTQNQMASALRAGVDTVSFDQVITFTQYLRVVLPLDGFVFWVRGDLVSPAARYAAFAGAEAQFAGAGDDASPPVQVRAQGSLHYSINQDQQEDASPTTGTIIFTSEVQVEALNAVSPTVTYIADFDGLRFAFSRLDNRYQQAGLWHYSGQVLTAPFSTQVVDDPALLDTHDVIVSNSLPAWLSLNAQVPVFPSFAVPENVRPPYITVDVPDDATETLQPLPYIDRVSSSWQLAADRVRLTMWGMRNAAAIDWVNYALQYMQMWDVLGLMEGPVLRDTKRTYPELNILGQRKVLEFRVSYYQARVNQLARQFITECVPSYTVGGYVPPVVRSAPAWDYTIPSNFSTRSFLGAFAGVSAPI